MTFSSDMNPSCNLRQCCRDMTTRRQLTDSEADFSLNDAFLPKREGMFWSEVDSTWPSDQGRDEHIFFEVECVYFG